MKRFIAIILLLLILTGCTKPAVEAPAIPTQTISEELVYGEISGEQMVSLIGTDVLIIDVRTAEEYAEGHIEGAQNIPVDQFQTAFDELTLSKDTPMALYCRSGNRSSVVYRILMDEGFDKIYHAPGVSQYDYPLVK